MLLIIHNLPSKIRYSDVKALIRDRCNLKDLIVDNLVYEGPQSRKVTVGLSDENDAIAVIKELDGLVYMGQKLVVEDVRKNQGSNTQKSNSNQGYSRGNMSHSVQAPIPSYMTPDLYSVPYYMSSQDLGSSMEANDSHRQPPIQPISSLPQYMQSKPYFMYGQDSSTGIPQKTNMMTQPSYGSPRMPVTQNTNMGYGESSNYGNNQPMTITSNQSEYIPRGNDHPRNEYSKNDSGSRYFEEKNDQKYRDRSERPSASRGDRESYEPRSRSVERRHDDWIPDRFRQSETMVSGKNPKQSRDFYNQSYDRNYKSEPEGSGFKRSSDDRRNAGSSENFADDYNRCYGNDQDDIYNRPSDRAPGNPNEITRYKWIKPKNGNEYKDANFDIYNDSKPGTSKGGNYSGNEFNPLNKFGNIQNTSTFPEHNESAIYLTKAEYKKIKKARELKQTALERKNETWRGQATSKIVRDALEDSGLMIQAGKPGFMQFMKSIVRSRINKMLGYRKAVPMDKILDEYYKKFPTNVRINFVLESKEKFNRITDYPSGAAPIRRPLMNQAQPERRPATEQPEAAPPPKKKPPVDIPRPPPYRPPTPGPLPKYPNADKQAYKKLKTLAKEEHEKEIYTLEPKLKQALENEIHDLRDLFVLGCRNNDGGEDETICQRIEDTTDKVMKVIKLDITKRLLNVTCNLPLRMFANGKFRVREVGPLLKPYGIISCRKSARSKLCVVLCQDYPSYDYLCTMKDIDIGDGLIMSFKPLHLAGPNKRSNKSDQKPPINDHTSGDEDEEFGEEMAGEGMGDEIIGDDEGADDLKEPVAKEAKEEKTDAKIKHIEIVDNESAEAKLKDEPTVEKASEIGTKKSDTKDPVTDVKELTNVIVNNEPEEIEDVHNEQILDESNIGQDDLEDY